MITQKDVEFLKKTFVTKRDLNKTKNEIIKAISNVAVNSPTSDQFYKLEKRVDRLEAAVN